jgi:hypothetical protein
VEEAITTRVPCIKGSAFKSVVPDVKRLVDEARIPPDVLDSRLTTGDRALLEETIDDDAWYPLANYARMLEVLRDFDGEGASDYLRRRGAAVAERLIAAGVYSQLNYARRMPDAKTRDAAVQNLRLLAGLYGAMFNVGAWKVESDPDNPLEYGLTISDAADFPDVACEPVAGFVAKLSEYSASITRSVTVERPTPDEIRFRFRTRGV